MQLSDLHVRVGDDELVAQERARAAVDFVCSMELDLDAVVLSGDIVNSPDLREHQLARELLEPIISLGIPLLPAVGNHDDRQYVRELFSATDTSLDLGQERHLQYVTRVGEIRVIVLDTQHTGFPDGKLCDTRRAWLEQRLNDDSDTTTILVMHHPPCLTGIPSFDQIGLRQDHAESFEEIVRAHPQIERIVCGHVHRGFTASIGQVPVFGCPSVFFPARPDFTAPTPIQLVDGPIGVGLHIKTSSGGVVSHFRVVA